MTVPKIYKDAVADNQFNEDFLITILRTFFGPELETRILPLKSSQVISLKPAFCRCL